METLQRTANRGSVSTGYDIANSCKFEADNSEYLSKTPSSAGNRKTWTFSGWVKRTEIGSGGNQILSAGDTYIQFDGNALQINFRAASENFFIITNRLFRDTSAWYHIVVQCDTTQGTASNRAKVWVNGVQETSFSTSTYDNMALNYDTLMNSTNEHEVGKYSNEETTYANLFNGYMAELHLVDGTALTPTSFGEFDDDSGIWKPKAYTGSHGTNGFYLDFEDGSNMGNDASGGTDFAETNITAADQATDTPTNNFATLNPLIYDINSGDDESYVCFNGATSIAASKNAYAQNYATIGLNIASGGKWYFEWTATSTANGSSSEGLCGLGFDTQWDAGLNSTGVYNAGYAFYAAGFGHGDGYGANVVNGFLVDLDNNKIKWYRNGSLHVTMPDDGGSTMQTSGYAFPYIAPYGSGYTINVNLGGFTAQAISSANTDPNGYGSFEYPTQDGYAICTKNLAEFG